MNQTANGPNPPEPGPFAGIRVIDVTHVLAGPFATYQLAVHGAEVIKVEPPEGDMVRILGGDAADNANGMGSAFLVQASNKRAITLDLKQPEGQAALKQLHWCMENAIKLRIPVLADCGVGKNWAEAH